MGLRTAELRLSTQGDTDVLDITSQVQDVVGDAGIGDGQALAFVRGSTAAISTMEFEPGGVHDLREMVERLDPRRRRLRAQPAQPRLKLARPSAGDRDRTIGGSSRHRWPPRARHLAAARPARLRRPAARAHRRRPSQLVAPASRSASTSVLRQAARLPRAEPAELDRPEAHPSQRDHVVADRLRHPANLPVATLPQHDLDLPLPQPPHLGRRRHPVLELHPAREPAQIGLARRPPQLDSVGLRHFVARMHQPVRQLPVVGQQQASPKNPRPAAPPG